MKLRKLSDEKLNSLLDSHLEQIRELISTETPCPEDVNIFGNYLSCESDFRTLRFSYNCLAGLLKDRGLKIPLLSELMNNPEKWCDDIHETLQTK